MNFLTSKPYFDALMGVKESPNEHEISLFTRAKKYTEPLIHIPGLEMIAVVNSLSMYATHPNSDIDLFIVTRPGYLWLVRVLVTCILACRGVWRKGHDIRGNFCLSFFVTTEAMNLEKIAIRDDVYLFFWVYSLKPMITRGAIYDEFLRENTWVTIPSEQRKINARSMTQFRERLPLLDPLWRFLSSLLRLMLEWRTLRKKEALGNPSGIIITPDMLKFHDNDQRERIREAVFHRG